MGGGLRPYRLPSQKLFLDEKLLGGRVSGQTLTPPWGEFFFTPQKGVVVLLAGGADHAVHGGVAANRALTTTV